MAKTTPMMEQYLHIKSHYQDAFLFFRLGDFYELFFDDAEQAARELEITLTKRGSGDDAIPMCGVPHHSSSTYITQLTSKGYKIAICEQVENPEDAKGVVKREVTKVVTPGTVVEESAVQAAENHFIAAVERLEGERSVFARTDLTTGRTAVMPLENERALRRELSASGMKEIIAAEGETSFWQNAAHEAGVVISEEPELAAVSGENEAFFHNLDETVYQTVAARLLAYLYSTQKRSLTHMQPAVIEEPARYMKLDIASKRNLELVQTMLDQTKKGSLLALIDETKTAMGARLLKRWLERPGFDEPEINRRLNFVEQAVQQSFKRDDLRDALTHVYDLERLAGKVSYGNVNARELIQLRNSLREIPEIQGITASLDESYSSRLEAAFQAMAQLERRLTEALIDEPPVSITDGGMIQDGYHDKLDQYREASRNGKTWISNLEQSERSETGIKSLKVGFNKVFGYYIEVTKPNIPSLPEGRYERKQTLTNAERFVTPELKEKEQLILEAQEQIDDLEYRLFLELREQVALCIPDLQALAAAVSEIDVLQGFAKVSEEKGYTRPSFSTNGRLYLKNSRHPVVEEVVSRHRYVANDIELDPTRRTLLITGPNMAGKSTYMRQTALASVMAQTGCFVAADEAELPLFDQVFTRIGAADDLASGESTFMVEMKEAQYALTHATTNSLILLDEIGRGTSTYDGMALAQAIVEYIHEKIQAKTLFSTHYHELTTLGDTISGIQNVHAACTEEDGRVVFLHKIQDGSADRSYGVYVAQLAELPDAVIERSEALLASFEQQEGTKEAQQVSREEEQLPLFTFEPAPPEIETPQQKTSTAKDSQDEAVLEAVKSVEVLHMTPMEALEKIQAWQKRLNE
ncbi:DNA mismatch repair protein MutS [Salsuginibacillus halophilus]|uniref:DNA mismatch repair protein MutS n=1 Tax=Salsuginibacillus halophilus TaxID=517424 RepID=A0A2P8HYI1_9BACI|nr:DNA mismatch repair protein MutS [Salsuginibacillus halophilus]PSL51269.1 DNA mismatch repair protein MutS [Salsuginibacillus halophilus]